MRKALQNRRLHTQFHRAMRRGVALLEVVVSLGILLVAMSVIGFTFRNGQHNLTMAEQMARAQLATEELITHIDTGYLLLTEPVQTGGFGDETEAGLAYRIFVNPSQTVPGLFEIDIEIHMGDPNGADNEHQLILANRILRVEPRGLDFERDFGMDEEQIQALSEAIPGGAQALDPKNFDPRMLAKLDLDQLTELLPVLLQAFGSKLTQGQIDKLMEAVQSGDLSGLQKAGQQISGGGQIPGGGSSGQQQGSGQGAGSSGGSSGQTGGRRVGGTRGGSSGSTPRTPGTKGR